MDSQVIPLANRLEKFDTYVNDVLRKDLSKVCEELDRAITDLAEFEQLEKTIEILREYKEKDKTFKTMIDIGCSYFMEAHVEDSSTILLNIGYGCYLEFALKDALLFIQTKKKLLNTRIEGLREKSAKIKAHIKLIFVYINQFNNPQAVQ